MRLWAGMVAAWTGSIWNLGLAAEPKPAPFEVSIHKVENVAELGGKKAMRGQFLCVQYVVTNHSKLEESFVPPHLVVDPVGTQTSESRDASNAYAPTDFKVDRPKFSNYKAGESMNRVGCFDALILESQKGRLNFTYGGYGAEHPPWTINVPFPAKTAAPGKR